MQSETGPVSKTMLWTGRIMSAVPVLLTLLGAVMKVVKAAPAVEGLARALDFPKDSLCPLEFLS
jgi:hypothetical protein